MRCRTSTDQWHGEGMKPRSLLLDLFGDYLRYAGPEVRAGDLTTLLQTLGVEPATTRVTLSRLRQGGWFTTERSGRETRYRLTSELFDILDEGRARIFAPYREDWDGTWTQLVFRLPDSDRAARDHLKQQLEWSGFGPLTAGVWIAPRDAVDSAARLARDHSSAEIEVMHLTTGDVRADRRLLERCWDVDALDADYERFIADHRHLLRSAPVLDGPGALRARTALTSTYRHFPYRDPSVPAALRPAGWHGAEAHDLFLRVHEALGPAAAAYVGSVVGADLHALGAARGAFENV